MKCVNCGMDIPDNSVFCDSCGTQQPPEAQKNNFTKIAIIAAASILAICIIATVIIVAFSSNPVIKLVKALDKTVFDSETLEYDIKFTEYGSSYNWIANISGNLSIGDTFEDTDMDTKVSLKKSNSSSAYGTIRVTLNNGDIKYKENDYSDTIELKQLFDDIERGIENSYSIDIDVEEFLDSVLNNKIDKDAIVDYYEENILPQIEEGFYEDYDGEREIGDVLDQDAATDIFTQFMESALEQEAIVFKDATSKSGTTYKYEIDLTKLCETAEEFVDTNEDFREYIGIYAEIYFERIEGEYLDFFKEYYNVENADEYAEYLLDDLKDVIKDMIEDIEDEHIEFDGKFTIDGGRLTFFSFNMSGEFLFEMTLKSDS